MNPVSFTLDRRLYELLHENGHSQFTTRDLRDAYAKRLYVKRLEGVDFHLGDVRRFVYKQIRRMVLTGWLVADKVQLERDQVYHLRPCPENLKLELVDGVFERSLKKTNREDHAVQGLTFVDSTLDAEQYLQSLLKEVRLDLLSAMGEAERYEQLVDDMPHLRDWVEGDYLEARDRSSRLQGHLRAVEKTFNTFVTSQ